MRQIRRRDALALSAAAPLFARSHPKVAITIDDVRWQSIPEARRAEAEQRLLTHVNKTRVCLFAWGRQVDNEPGAAILNSWAAAGHWIGNHTYSHRPLMGNTNTDDFGKDVLRDRELCAGSAGSKSCFVFLP